MGRGFLFAKEQMILLEGFFKGSSSLIFGRYIENESKRLYIGEISENYFEGKGTLIDEEDRGGEYTYIGKFEQDNFDDMGIVIL
jgi:hypothetical protein